MPSTYAAELAAAPAISELCDRLVPARHHQPAVDLVGVAQRLGAADVLYQASRIHGYTRWEERGPTLVLAMAKTEGRRRATLAHEIAHMVLNPAVQPDASISVTVRRGALRWLGPDVASFARAVATLGIERVCDQVAFELLLPRVRARALDVQRLSSASELVACAGLMRISLALLVNQARRAGLPLQLLRLAPTWDGSWVIAAAAGRSAGWPIGATVDRQTATYLSTLTSGSRATIGDLALEAQQDAYPFSLVRHGATIIAVRQAAGALQHFSGQPDLQLR